MRTSFTDLIRSVSSANYTTANQVFGNIMQQLVADRLAVEKTRIFKEDAEMSDAEMKKREEIVKSMKGSTQDFKDRYGDRWKEVMYATATKQAMSEADDTKYQEYFRTMLKKHGYDSPADIPDDKKDEFFNAVDAGYKAKNESRFKNEDYSRRGRVINEDLSWTGFFDFIIYYTAYDIATWLLGIVVFYGLVLSKMAMFLPSKLKAFARECLHAYETYRTSKHLSASDIQRVTAAAKQVYPTLSPRVKALITTLSKKLEGSDLTSDSGRRMAAQQLNQLASIAKTTPIEEQFTNGE